MKRVGGEVLALSTDEVEDARRLVAELALPFRVLSTRGIPVLADYGLEHVAGHDGGSIAVPAQLLVRSDGGIAWRYVARSINARVDPRETLAEIEREFGSRPPARR